MHQDSTDFINGSLGAKLFREVTKQVWVLTVLIVFIFHKNTSAPIAMSKRQMDFHQSQFEHKLHRNMIWFTDCFKMERRHILAKQALNSGGVCFFYLISVYFVHMSFENHHQCVHVMNILWRSEKNNYRGGEW